MGPSVPEDARHIVLVGLMGSGKTTVGKKLAKLLPRPFIDADVELEARSGQSVAEWFSNEGEAAFRAAEGALLADVLAATEPVVLGAGGGVVTRPTNRDRLQEADVAVVYLHGTPQFLASRAKPKAHRPLLQGDPAEVLAQMYEQRDPWYRQVADVVVEIQPAHEAGTKPKWRIAEQVVEALDELGVSP